MIVRISGEDQYELEDSELARLHELDDAVQHALEAGDEEGFKSSFETLLDFVRSNGVVLADDVLEGSDLILPPADLSLAEAKVEFRSEGLIPD